MTKPDMIRVEIAYALPEEQLILVVELARGSTVQQAIEQSGIWERHPDIDPVRNPVGVFGRRIPLTQVLQEGDRVEIYRSLVADPKLSRRLRAEQVRARDQNELAGKKSAGSGQRKPGAR